MSNSFFKTTQIACVVGACGLMGCATAAPQELVDARAAYRQAEMGTAARHAPADLDNAKNSLARAEKAFKDEPKAVATRDYAYVAERQAQLAEVKSNIQISKEKKLSSKVALDKAVEAKLDEAKDKLADSQQETRDSEKKVAEAETNNAKEQLASEHEARVKAEDQTKAMLEELAKIGTVKEESRGTVIVLPGNILFATGQSSLLGGAESRLDKVAAVLNERTGQTVTIEGHTDSTGSTSLNEALSLHRAEAVRNYLVSAGVARTRIQTVGMGMTKPIDTNSTAEGRANNRRVEIVLAPNQS
jgi:outer membrane protein OmpA-like peptidoglycan-associated protein